MKTVIEKYVIADRFLICLQTDCLPAINYLEENSEEFSHLTIHFQTSNAGTPLLFFQYEDSTPMEVSFLQDEKKLLFRCPWEQISKSTILPMMFRLMVEWLRQKDGEIKLHASAVERDGFTALFLAPSEGGKTTTAMAMCREYHCFLQANDASVCKLISGTPFFLRGDSEFRVRYNGLEAYSPQIFEHKTSGLLPSDLPWYNKLSLQAEDVGVRLSSAMTPIRLVFFVRLDPLTEGVRVIEYSSDYEARRKLWFKPNMMVLQNIAGTIRGSDLIPIGNSGKLLPLVLPSLDTHDFSTHRADFVNTLFSSCKVFQVRGQLQPMTDCINQLMTRESQL